MYLPCNMAHVAKCSSINRWNSLCAINWLAVTSSHQTTLVCHLSQVPGDAKLKRVKQSVDRTTSVREHMVTQMCISGLISPANSITFTALCFSPLQSTPLYSTPLHRNNSSIMLTYSASPEISHSQACIASHQSRQSVTNF